MANFMRLTLLEIIGLAAIILGPIVAIFLPENARVQISSADVSLKDIVLLCLIILLSCSILFVRSLKKIMDLVSPKSLYRLAEFHYFYAQGGTVITRNRFDLLNGWSSSSKLPQENLIWHREINENDIVYRLYERGRLRDRTLSADQPRIEYIVPPSEKSDDDNHRYIWEPDIYPPLGRKESITYVVEIISEGTETDAFSPNGTKLGFGLNAPCRRAEVVAYAPFGYRFVLVGPSFTVRRSSDLTEIAVARKVEPNVSPDGTILTMTVKRPKVGERYWAHYRFEPIGS